MTHALIALKRSKREVSGSTRRRFTYRQQGQALAEFLGVAVALVPLFLLFPMIGKYQDLAHATQMASRYAAFDATRYGNVDGFNDWKPPAQLAAEIRRRFYGNANAPIKTGDVAGEFDAHRNLFWRDPYDHALIRDFSDVGISFGAASALQSDGFSNAGADGAAFNTIPLANANKIGLAAQGVYSANVAVGLANLPGNIKSVRPFDAIDLRIQRHTSLLFDPWSSPTTQKTEELVGKLAPLNPALSAVSPVIDAALVAIDRSGSSSTDGKKEEAGVEFPEFGDLRKWRDVVPSDRLVPEN